MNPYDHTQVTFNRLHDSGPTNPHSDRPTDAEHLEIERAIARHFDAMDEDDNYIEPERIRVMRSYMSDGPGWVGTMAWVVFGECCCQMILRRIGGEWVPYFGLDGTNASMYDFN